MDEESTLAQGGKRESREGGKGKQGEMIKLDDRQTHKTRNRNGAMDWQ